MGSAATLFVVSRVGQIERIADLHHAGIFYAAFSLIGCFSDHHRFSSPYEMNAILTGGVTKRRFALVILGAIKHHELSVVLDHRRIECSG